MPTNTWGPSYVPGRNLGGAVSPGHDTYNAYTNPNTYYYGGPGTVQRGLNLGAAPKPPPAPDPFAGLSWPQMPQFNTGGMFNAMGLPPPPPDPYITSSIPLQQMAGQFLPKSVVDQGVNAQVEKNLQAANPVQIREQYAATPGNMASAMSGQYVAPIMSQMQDPLQASAMTQGQLPADAALQRYNFGTQGLQGQTGEVSKLAGLANQNYNNRLSAYSQRMNQMQQGLGMLFG